MPYPETIVPFIIFGSFGLFIYFVPWLVATKREHRNADAIGVLNLLLGWTFIFWVIALVWAMTDNTDKRVRER